MNLNLMNFDNFKGDEAVMEITDYMEMSDKKVVTLNKVDTESSTEVIAADTEITTLDTVSDKSLSVINKDELLEQLRNTPTRQIDTYGASIQDIIGDQSSDILARTGMSELGEIRDNIDELGTIVNKQKGLMSKSIIVKKIKRFVSGYEKVQEKIDNITGALEEQKENLDKYVDYMMEQSDNLNEALNKLRVYENALDEYTGELQDNSYDELRLQVAANRLKLITGTRVNAEQAQVEVLMIIKENQEAKYQLAQIIQNVVPILKIQAVNSVGIRVNKESMAIAEKTRKITSEIIQKNASDINSMAKQLQANRTRGVVDTDALLRAQDSLKEALEMVSKASVIEAKTNLELTNTLKKKAEENQEFIERLKGDN